MNEKLQFLSLPDRRLAYQSLRAGEGPGIFFLGGYASDMTGTKASFLAEKALQESRSFTRFDYRGCGQSEGDFRQSTIGNWLDDACQVLDKVTTKTQIIVGSSMGGWLGLMLALKRPERLKAFIGIAAAPDFTETLIWDQLTDAQKAHLDQIGEILDPSSDSSAPLFITKTLILEGRGHLLLQKEIPIACPVHLIQGQKDEDVPWQHALRIAEKITHADVRITLVKDGDHRLSRPQDLDYLWQVIRAM